MKLTLLGTGSPNVNPQRRGSSQVIESGDELVLIDCGAGTAHRLVEAGYGRRKIKQLVFTHLHSDHITGLADLLWGGWVGLWWKEPPLVAGPPGTKDFIDYLMKAFEYDISVRTKPSAIEGVGGGEGLKREWLVPHVQEVEDGWKARGADWELSAFRVDHVQVDEAFGFRMDGPGGSIAISGDTRRSENLIAKAHGADILVHEVMRLGGPTPDDPWLVERRDRINAYHTSSTEVGKIASDAEAKHLVLSHIIVREGTLDDMRDDVEQDFKHQLTVGEDLLSVDLPGPTIR